MRGLKKITDRIDACVYQGASGTEILELIENETQPCGDFHNLDEREALLEHYHNLLCDIGDANYSNGEAQ